MSKSPSEKLSVVVVVSFVAFLAFAHCTAQAIETKYLLYGFNLAAISATTQGLGISIEPVRRDVRSSNVFTKEPPKTSPVIVTFSNYDDIDIPFDIDRIVFNFYRPMVVRCPPNEVVTINRKCRSRATY